MHLEVISRLPASGTSPTPLLFVHGAWGGAWSWDEYVLPYMAEHGYAAHALSLRGHAGSAGRVFGARIRHYVQDVAQVAATLPAPPVLIGHSMGGYVVQKYLETHDAPAGVLVASAIPASNYRVALRILRKMPLALLWANLTFRLRPLVSTPERMRAHLFSADLAADRLASYHARLSAESMLAFLDMMGLDRVGTGRITTPLLVIGAGSDASFSRRDVERMARRYGTEAVIIPGVAHRIQLEDRWQVMADRVLAWLAEQGV